MFRGDQTNAQMMAQGVQHMGQQQPDLLHSLMEPEGTMGGGNGMAGLAGLVTKPLLGGQGGGLVSNQCAVPRRARWHPRPF